MFLIILCPRRPSGGTGTKLIFVIFPLVFLLELSPCFFISPCAVLKEERIAVSPFIIAGCPAVFYLSWITELFLSIIECTEHIHALFNVCVIEVAYQLTALKTDKGLTCCSDKCVVKGSVTVKRILCVVGICELSCHFDAL